MNSWSTDIKSAPHGRYEIKQRREGVDIRVFVPERVILTTKCGKVTISHYQPGVKRWEMLADGELPVAWMHHQPGLALPEPYSLPVPQSQAAERPDALPLAASGHQSRADGGANIIMKHEEIRS